jgi:hypothetical protein
MIVYREHVAEKCARFSRRVGTTLRDYDLRKNKYEQPAFPDPTRN